MMTDLFLCFFLCFSLLLSAQPRLYLTNPITKPVRIDGLADDPVWADAPVAGSFIGVKNFWPQESTTVRVAYDTEALYLLAQGANQPGSQLTSKCRRHDDLSVFRDESLEFFLVPKQVLEAGSLQNNSDIYFHLCFNLDGYFYSARNHDLSWQPQGIEQKTFINSRHWQMEFRIPFISLQTNTPLPGTSWQVNFSRNSQGSSTEVSSWSGSSNFHDLKTFGQLFFGVTPTWEPAVITLLEIDANQITCALQLPPNPPADLQAQIILDQAVTIASKGIDPLTPGFITFRESICDNFLPLKRIPQLAFKVFSQSSKQVFLEQEAGLILNFQNILSLDKYYYTAEDGKLHFSLNPGAADGKVKTDKLKLCLLQDCHQSNKSLRSMDWNSLSGNLQLGSLPFGTLYLQASWEQNGKSYQTLRAFQYNPHTLKPATLPPNAKLSARKTQLFLNETPIFLIAASPTGKNFLQNQDCFNLSYGQYGLQQNAVHLETVQGARLLRKDGWVGYTFPPWEQLQELLRKQFQASSPSHMRFCRIAYEAQMGTACKTADGRLDYLNTPQWYQKIYQELKQLSPETLFSLQIDNLPVAAEFAPHCDIFEVASWDSSYSFDIMKNLQRDMAAVRESCPDKPVIFWLGGTIPNNQCRTAEELRAGAFMAIASDLAGLIIHMGHGYLPAERSRLWSMLSNLNAEIQPVFQFFQQAGQTVTYPFENTQGFHLVARQKGEVISVIAINQKGTLNTLVLPDHASILLPFENKRTLNRQEDSFSPYEAKVYQIHVKP